MDEPLIRQLFVAGCQRSGTTALLDFLNRDPRIALGRERFKFVTGEISPASFAPEHFLSPMASETNFLSGAEFDDARSKFEAGTLRYLGDKTPRYGMVLARLLKVFEHGKVLFLHRDLLRVAASFNARAANPKDRWPRENDYRQAVKTWSKNLERFVQAKEGPGSDRVLGVRYEDFFSNGDRQLQRLYSFLQLEVTDAVISAYHETCDGWERRAAADLNLSEREVDELLRLKPNDLETEARQFFD